MLKRIFALSTALAVFFMSPLAQAEELTGDTKLACEALLCLSSGTRPGECNESIKKYFSI